MPRKARKEKETLRFFLFGWLLIPSVFFADRAFKIWVVGHLKEAESVPVWQGVFHLTRVENTGAAFGVWRGSAFFLTIITLASVLAIFIYLLRIQVMARTPKTNFHGWALVAGGALGNLYDRLRFGHVIDFLDFRFWPVFNVADACICLGVFFIFWNIFYASDPV